MTTCKMGGSFQDYKPMILGQRLKAPTFSFGCGNSAYAFFPQLRSSHTALDSSLGLSVNTDFYYETKTIAQVINVVRKRAFLFLVLPPSFSQSAILKSSLVVAPNSLTSCFLPH